MAWMASASRIWTWSRRRSRKRHGPKRWTGGCTTRFATASTRRDLLRLRRPTIGRSPAYSNTWRSKLYNVGRHRGGCVVFNQSSLRKRKPYPKRTARRRAFVMGTISANIDILFCKQTLHSWHMKGARSSDRETLTRGSSRRFGTRFCALKLRTIAG